MVSVRSTALSENPKFIVAIDTERKVIEIQRIQRDNGRVMVVLIKDRETLDKITDGLYEMAQILWPLSDDEIEAQRVGIAKGWVQDGLTIIPTETGHKIELKKTS